MAVSRTLQQSSASFDAFLENFVAHSRQHPNRIQIFGIAPFPTTCQEEWHIVRTGPRWFRNRGVRLVEVDCHASPALPGYPFRFLPVLPLDVLILFRTRDMPREGHSEQMPANPRQIDIVRTYQRRTPC